MSEWLKNLSKSLLSSIIIFLILFTSIYLGVYKGFIFPLIFLIFILILRILFWLNKSNTIIDLKSKIMGTEGWLYISWILVALIFSALILKIHGPFEGNFAELYLLHLIFPLIIIAIFGKMRIYTELVINTYRVYETVKHGPSKMQSNQKFKIPKFSAPISLIEVLDMIIILMFIIIVFVYSFA